MSGEGRGVGGQVRMRVLKKVEGAGRRGGLRCHCVRKLFSRGRDFGGTRWGYTTLCYRPLYGTREGGSWDVGTGRRGPRSRVQGRWWIAACTDSVKRMRGKRRGGVRGALTMQVGSSELGTVRACLRAGGEGGGVRQKSWKADVCGRPRGRQPRAAALLYAVRYRWYGARRVPLMVLYPRVLYCSVFQGWFPQPCLV